VEPPGFFFAGFPLLEASLIEAPQVAVLAFFHLPIGTGVFFFSVGFLGMARARSNSVTVEPLPGSSRHFSNRRNPTIFSLFFSDSVGKVSFLTRSPLFSFFSV